MGIGHRVFIINGLDEIIRIPVAKYERLFAKDPIESMPEYRNQRVRFAHIHYDTVDRRPVSIWRTEYSYVHFDDEGKIDWDMHKGGMKHAMESLEGKFTPTVPNKENKIIYAEKRFEAKKYQDRTFWEPSQELEEAIWGMVFKSKHRGR